MCGTIPFNRVAIVRDNSHLAHNSHITFMRETSITITSGGQQVFGVLHIPARRSKAPLVILVHGWSGNLLGTWNAFFVRTARAFARRGFAVFRFDFRGSGNSNGVFEQQNHSSMLLDLKNVVSQVSTHEGIDARRIALIGHSQGGYLSILHASRDRRIRALILWMGRTADIKDFWSKTTFDEIRRKGFTIWYDHKVIKKYADDSMKYHSEPALRKIKVPIGMIYGEADGVVPPSEGLRVMRYAKGPKRLNILKDLDHDFSGEKPKVMVIATTLGWLRRWLR